MGNFNITNSIMVNAPIDEAYEKFNNAEFLDEWMDNPRERRNYSGSMAVGAKWESVTEFMGRDIISKITVIAIDAPYLFHFHVDSNSYVGEIQHQFKKVEAGVRVSMVFDGETSGFLASLAAPLLKGQADKQMQGDLASFKRYMES